MMKPEVNLLPKFERYSNLSCILFVILLVLFVVLAGVLTYFFLNENNTITETETNIVQLEQEKEILVTRLNALTDDNTETLKDAVEFAKAQAIPVSGLVDEFMELLPDFSYLTNYTYNYSNVRIDTQFETMSETAEYMGLLTNSVLLVDPVVDEISQLHLLEDEEIIDKFDLDMDEDGSNEYLIEQIRNSEVIPRYQASFSMDVNQRAIVEEAENE